jgi:outer membrane protein assembly factor BamB
MAGRDFNCPKCGAPIDYDGSDTPTVRCGFCQTSVIVPPELRPKKEPEPVVQPETFQPQIVISTSEFSPRLNTRLVGGLIVFVVLCVLVSTLVPVLFTWQAGRAVSEVILPQIELATTRLPNAVSTVAVSAIPTATPQPSLTPTPAFASEKARFGSAGIGSGLLTDARYITIDGAGTVYVADYQDGRIQAFDADGKYLHGWQVGDEKTIIYAMVASHDGTLFVAYAGNIYRYEGATGALLDQVAYDAGPEFGDLAVTNGGELLAVWYEGRWGMITSLQGHREDLVWFDAAGETLRVQKSPISGQTEDLALDVLIAVDGLGNVFATNYGEIYKFASDGRFVDRFAAQEAGASGSFSVRTLAVDGRGRVFVGGSRQVAIFSPDGRFLKAFATDVSVNDMAFSQQGDLYVLSGDQVVKYSLGVLP